MFSFSSKPEIKKKEEVYNDSESEGECTALIANDNGTNR